MAGRSNRWILHPWLPIDVRLPATVGVLGTGMYIYLERSGQIGQAHEWAKKAQKDTEQAMESVQARVSSAWKWPQLSQWWPKSKVDDVKEADENIGIQSQVVEDVREQGTSDTSAESLHQSEEEGPTVTADDVRKIDNLMQEALLNKPPQVASEEQPSADLSASKSADLIEASTASVTKTDPMLPQIDLVAKLEHTARNQIVVAATADKGGLADSRKPFDGGAHSELSNHVLHTAGVMGLSSDVSAATLLSNAKRQGLSSWGAAGSVAAKQAVADTATLQEVLSAMEKHHRHAIKEAEASSEHWQQQAQQSKLLAEEVSKGTRQVLDEQAEAHKLVMQANLKSKAQQMAEDFAAEFSAERKERFRALEELGEKVSQLHSALARRKAEVEQFNSAYGITGAVTAVQNILLTGCQVDDVVALLQAVERDDPLVRAARFGLAANASVRLASVHELQQRWPSVRRSLQIKGALNRDTQPGILSTFLAGAIARIKVSEWAALRLGQHARTLDGQLTAIDECMAQGDLRQVVVLLEEIQSILHVDHVADSFQSAVRAKAMADQTVELLKAHAFAMGKLALA